MTVGAYLLSLIDASTNDWVMAGYMFVFGVGMGLVMQVLVVAVQNAVSYETSGVATSQSDVLPHDRRLLRDGGLRRHLRHCLLPPTWPRSRRRSSGPSTRRRSTPSPAGSSRRGGPALLRQVHRRGDACGAGRVPRRGADLVRGVPAQLPAARGGACASPWRRSTSARLQGRRGRRRFRRSSSRSTGVGPGEPGRSCTDPGGTGRDRPAARSCWLLYRLADRPACTVADVAERLKVDPEIIKPGVTAWSRPAWCPRSIVGPNATWP